MAKHFLELRPRATTAGLGLVICLFLVNASISHRNTQRLKSVDFHIVQGQTMLTTLEEVLASVTAAETRERGFLITGDETYLKSYDDAASQAARALATLDRLIAGEPGEQTAATSLRKLVDDRLAELRTAIAARRTGGFAEAQAAVLNNHGRELMRTMRTLVDDLQRRQHAKLRAWTAESQRSERITTITDLAGTLMGVGTVGLAYLLFRRERRQRERADDAGRQLAAIVESSDDAIVGETLEGVIVSWNAGAERIYGYSAAEAIGQTIFMICPPEVMGEAQHNLELVGRGIRIEPFESQRLCKDGRKISVSVSISPIRDASGRVVGASRISRDITQQRLLQREVLEIAAREQQRIGQDLHDGAGQELTGLAMLAAQLSEDLSGLRLTQAAAAAKIVRGLEEALDHVRALAKGLVPVEVDAEGLMAALAELAARADELGGVRCEFRCDKPVSISDNQTATQLYRLAQEAVTNALKHARAREIAIDLKAEHNIVTLSVADDGQGLPEPMAPTAGSGLRIMRYRAELIGAEFRLAPNRPHGTVVVCTLAQQQPAFSQQESAAQESRNFSHAKTGNDGIHARGMSDLRSWYGPPLNCAAGDQAEE
ncbi:MAG TPA: CHASE3 domain-containing protein [Pirellulales bacterium]|nr:CHASE3 domain-containing protein [Pirellulales bacterium]